MEKQTTAAKGTKRAARTSRIRIGNLIEYHLPGRHSERLVGAIEEIEIAYPVKGGEGYGHKKVHSTTQRIHDVLITVKTGGESLWISPRHIVKVIG